MPNTYYFPFGATGVSQTQSISYALSATTASLPVSSTVLAITASYAITSASNPTAGTNGVNQNPALCGTSTIVGDKGLQGPTGSVGSDADCPTGTIRCMALEISLSANWIHRPNIGGGGNRGVNYFRDSGSQFSKVCMEIPPGCTGAQAICPPALPTSSVTSTYPVIP